MKNGKLTIREMAVFAMLGALMYASKMIMEVAPNVHLLGVFTIAFTVVYRKKALYPIYTYVLLNGIFCGFATWWISLICICGQCCGERPCCYQNGFRRSFVRLSICCCVLLMASYSELCMHRRRRCCMV